MDKSQPSGRTVVLDATSIPAGIWRGIDYLVRAVKARPAPGLIVAVDHELARHPSALAAVALGLLAVDGSDDGRYYILRVPADRGDA